MPAGLPALGAAGSSLTPEQLAQLEGILQAIDQVSGKITIRLKDGTVRTFILKSPDSIPVSGSGGDPSLEPGDPVMVRLDSEGDEVTQVVARRAKVEGAVEAVDPQNRTLTLAPEHGGGPVTLTVPEDARIQFEHRGPEVSPTSSPAGR